MRLHVILVISFVIIAALVGLVGYLVGQTGEQILVEVGHLRDSGLAESEAAARMTRALHFSQIAAHEIVEARYRTLADPTAWPVGEPDHEWQPDPEAERLIGELTASTRDLRDDLGAGREVTKAALETLSTRLPKVATAMAVPEVEALLDELEAAFVVYEGLVDELIHEARYHPTADVSEFVSTRLEAHYHSSMLPAVTAYGEYARRGLDEQLSVMDAAFSSANRRNLLLTATALVSAITLGLVIARSISRPLDKLQSALGRFGAGELDTRVDLDTRTEIGVVADAFNGMVETLNSTTISRSYLDSIIQSMNEMLFVADADGRVETVNRAALEGLGYEREHLVGHPISVLFAPSEPGDTLQDTSDLRSDGDRRLTTRAGETIIVSVSSAELNGLASGATLYLAQDITQRKAAERTLKNSIAEKDVLLKEVHHRVKNNMQVISSLLSLQSAETASPEVSRAFRDSRNRIRSMALIHEHPYRSEDLANIAFRPYVESLIGQVCRSHTGGRSRHDIDVDVEETTLPVDAAIAYGMTINELVSNALEHAFRPGESGQVAVRFLSEPEGYRLVVSDNGRGVGAEVDPEHSDSLGLRLVREFVSQLHGRIRFDTSDGTRVTIASPRVASEALDDAGAEATSGRSS